MVPWPGVSHCLVLEALRGTHNAALAEYVGCAALAYVLVNEIPQRGSSRTMHNGSKEFYTPQRT